MEDYIRAISRPAAFIKLNARILKLPFRKIRGLFIQNEATVPAEFKEQVISWKIDKTAIKEAIKNGGAVHGAALVNGTRLVIR